MNIKKSLSFLCVFLAIAFCIFGESIKERWFARSAPKQKEAAIDRSAEKVSLKDCLCYCSDICEPRYADKPGDAPFIDPETGICFCQERDRVHYKKCEARNNAKGFKSCCQGEAKYKK